jgi:hypothetical protein
MKYLLIPCLVLLTGCVAINGLKKTESVSSPENYEIVARNIYDAAKKCWERDPIFPIRFGTLVKSMVTLEGIVIVVGFSSTMEHMGQVAIKFIVQEDGTGSIIEIYEPNVPSLVAGEFQIAHKWIQGNYACEP